MSNDSSEAKKFWNPWLAIILLVAVYYLTQVVGGLVLSIYPALMHWSQARAETWVQGSVWAQFFYVVVAETLSVLAIYKLLKIKKLSWRDIGLGRWPKWTDPIWALSLLPIYLIANLVLTGVLHGLIPAINLTQQQQIGFTDVHGALPLVLTFVSLVVLPPIAEEVMVRGFLYGSLRRATLSKLSAALITSGIFAAAHLQFGSGAPLLWTAFIDTFILSMFLVWLREKTGSLWAGMALHAFKNLIAFAALFIFHVG